MRGGVTDICQVSTTSLIQTLVDFYVSNLERLDPLLKDLDQPVNEWRAQLSEFLVEASNKLDPTSLSEANARQVLGISDDTHQAILFKSLDLNASKYHRLGLLI